MLEKHEKFVGKNTLAYFGTPSVTKKKILITLSSGEIKNNFN
jgi:hypothetical protein